MVAKGFIAAAAIIICCSTTLRGNDQEPACSGGEPPAACSEEKCSVTKCTVSKTASTADQGDDEKCCKKEKVALEKCATEKCSTEKCSGGKCSIDKVSTEKCATEKCAASKCSTGDSSATKVAKVAKLKCVVETAAADATGDDDCCEKKKCSADAVAAVGEGCASSKCVLQTADVALNQCNGPQCPVAACAGPVADVLKVAVNAGDKGDAKKSCTTDASCATAACGASRCAALQTAGEESTCSKAQDAVRIVSEDRAIQQEMLATKLAEQQRLQREIEMLRRLVDATDVEVRLSEGQSAYETALLIAAAIEPDYRTVVYPVPDLQVWKVRPDGVEFDADLLVDYIVTTVDPQSWRGAVHADSVQAERANGEIQPFERNGSLVICQTEANHAKIADLFRKMRVEGQRKDAAREERELRVTPVSAEAPVSTGAKCSKGSCDEGKCSSSKCSQSKCDKEATAIDADWHSAVGLPLGMGVAPEVRLDVSLITDSIGSSCADAGGENCPCIGGTLSK